VWRCTPRPGVQFRGSSARHANRSDLDSRVGGAPARGGQAAGSGHPGWVFVQSSTADSGVAPCLHERVSQTVIDTKAILKHLGVRVGQKNCRFRWGAVARGPAPGVRVAGRWHDQHEHQHARRDSYLSSHDDPNSRDGPKLWNTSQAWLEQAESGAPTADDPQQSMLASTLVTRRYDASAGSVGA
jgi:hypothetical protein